MSKEKPKQKLVAENRRARFDYYIEDTIEAGIMLVGTEVKSLRQGKGNIAESYASVEESELWLINAHIPEYFQANKYNHEERRKRKLLVKFRELSRLYQSTQREGMTLVPLRMYFNEKGIIKLELGIAKGKKLHDKRETSQKRDWNRQKSRLMRDRG
jgi:SsrA-binding protein